MNIAQLWHDDSCRGDADCCWGYLRSSHVDVLCDVFSTALRTNQLVCNPKVFWLLVFLLGEDLACLAYYTRGGHNVFDFVLIRSGNHQTLCRQMQLTCTTRSLYVLPMCVKPAILFRPTLFMFSAPFHCVRCRQHPLHGCTHTFWDACVLNPRAGILRHRKCNDEGNAPGHVM